jgi:hypothetical protein
MPDLSDLDGLQLGEDTVDAVYRGATQVYSAEGGPPPSSKNMLTVNEASFETSVPESLFDVWGEGNAVIRSGAKAWHDEHSLRIQSAYEENYIEFGIRVPEGLEPATQYTAHFALLGEAGGREIDARIAWLRANGTIISSSYSDVFESVADEWTIITVTATSPANTVGAILLWQFVTMDDPEYFYVDGLGLWLGDSTDWEVPV